MKKARTVAQRYADYKRTFPRKINDRRCELIVKMHSGFTDEENSRTFADHPGWRKESLQRERANLTDAERTEYEECTRVVNEWAAQAPWTIDQRAFMDKQNARLDTLMRRLKHTDAFTLVELLIVLAIVALVSVAVLPTIVPAITHRKVSESARLLQATIEGARDSAIRHNSPRGVRLLPDPTSPPGTLACNRLVPIEPAPDYSEGAISITSFPNPTAAQVAIPGSSPAAAYPPSALRVEESRVDGNGLPNARTSWAWNVRVGDRIRLGKAGRLYTICGPMATLPGAGNPEKFVNYGPPGTTPPMVRTIGGTDYDVEFLYVVNGQDDNGDGRTDQGWDGSGWDGKDTDGDGVTDEATEGPPFDFDGNGVLDLNPPEWEAERWLGPESGAGLVNSTYTIKRGPVVTPGGQVVPLPSNVVIDLTTWDSTRERSRLPVDPQTLTVDIMIRPDGTVAPPADLPGRPIPAGAPFFHAWLSESADVHVPAAAGSPRLPMPSGVIPGATTTLAGERRLVSLNTRTGLIVSNEVEVFDATNVNVPFYEAQSGTREAR